MDPIKIKCCRVCKTKTLQEVCDFGNLFISTFVSVLGENVGKCPLQLLKCSSCDLVQLAHNPPQELLYKKKYWYRSGTNPVIVDDLKAIVEECMRYKKQGTWIDIGANDGTLLKYVPKNLFFRIGIEPASNLKESLAENTDLALFDFWEDISCEKADIITAIGMFYDSEDPNQFIKNVKSHLKEDGVFVAQMMTLSGMISKNDLGNVCHEHLEYYSYKSLRRLMERNGLEITRLDTNGINGGSYRIFCRHKKDGSLSISESLINWAGFQENINTNRIKTLNLLRELKKEGKKVYGYGASTKGNTYLQHYGIGPDLLCGIADINPEKIGKMTVGTHISIIHESYARQEADYFLVFPYGFRDYFLNKEKKWRENGGKFIFCTPNFEVI